MPADSDPLRAQFNSLMSQAAGMGFSHERHGVNEKIYALRRQPPEAPKPDTPQARLLAQLGSSRQLAVQRRLPPFRN